MNIDGIERCIHLLFEPEFDIDRNIEAEATHCVFISFLSTLSTTLSHAHQVPESQKSNNIELHGRTVAHRVSR